MALFQIRTFRSLLQDAVNRVVARSDLTDVVPGSRLMQVLGASARMVEQLYIETARLLELFSIWQAQGEDLDARGRDYMPDGIERRGKTRATGTLRWTRPVATGVAVAIPVGTTVAKLNSNPRVVYVTTAVGEIPAGGTQSQRTDGPAGDIPARAEVLGATGNAPADTCRKAISVVAGTSAVTNPTPFLGGIDAETDDEYRARIVARTRSLPRCIPEALETRAMDAVLEGRQITSAKLVRNVWERGNDTLYIDDGTGAVETSELAMAEVVVGSATGGERHFYTDYRPIKSDTLTVRRNGALLVQGVDYELVLPWGQISLSRTAYPTGLTAEDEITVGAYEYWTGLIREAQRLIDGDPEDPVDTTSWKAGGVVIRVRTPVVRWMLVAATVVVRDGFSRDVAREAVEVAISDYINSLNVGDDVIHAELVERAMGVPGLFDIVFSAPAQNTPIGDDELARVQSSDITID